MKSTPYLLSRSRSQPRAVTLLRKLINSAANTKGTRRIDRHDSARKDFMTRILDKRDPKEVSDLQLAAHASDFVLGGSETTATTLSCIIYYLVKNPDIKLKLQEEIRTRYQHYSEINSSTAQHLPYLKAVILEGLRIFPPVPFALPRVVPEGGDSVDGHFLPEGVSLSMLRSKDGTEDMDLS